MLQQNFRLLKSISSNRYPDKLGAKDVWPPGEFAFVASRKFEKDSSPANGSSIAVMFGFEDKLVLLTGDAHPGVVTNGVSTDWPSDRPVVSLLKLSHHGSKANPNEALLKALECKRFLIRTNGENYQDPDVTMLASVLKIKANPTFLFNYALERTLWWSDVPEDWPPFVNLYAEPGAAFIQIDI
ncbi:hypothetical protein C8J31_1204 [Rhizobium sp. PP-CC-2G-626]|nr:hypothetical protein C8J31_1204 [Rhizobium sp. PP-CC-2G-626]